MSGVGCHCPPLFLFLFYLLLLYNARQSRAQHVFPSVERGSKKARCEDGVCVYVWTCVQRSEAVPVRRTQKKKERKIMIISIPPPQQSQKKMARFLFSRNE